MYTHTRTRIHRHTRATWQSLKNFVAYRTAQNFILSTLLRCLPRTHTHTHVCCAAVVDALKKNSLVKFANYHIFIKQTKFPKLKRSLPALFPLPLFPSPSACCCQFQSASLCSAALPVPSVHLWQLHLRLQQSASTTRPRLTCFACPAPLTSPLLSVPLALPCPPLLILLKIIL